MMTNTRIRTRLHMGCGETLSGRFVAAPDKGNASKMLKGGVNSKLSGSKTRRAVNK